jgi:hypothetical protein
MKEWMDSAKLNLRNAYLDPISLARHVTLDLYYGKMIILHLRVPRQGERGN